ncbi:outer membrane lipoprotein-sorting protein [Alkaliflexus imshenetskii]|uniref:outer membrane lipoprotein-sorting protein n=1 Tax=Alkaliflexus imshenetskii TaxID=286730 RepID=UPI0004B3C817|nr:outer membrane lipoprotein-sorting protein [Alkaliflexus imshenetskii]
MKRSLLVFRLTMMAITLFCFVAISVADNPVEIIRKMEQRMQGNSSYAEMTMKTVRPRYTREVSMKAWSKGDDFSLIFITAPARDKGTGFLKRGKEIWNFVPSIDRTIKMPPSMMSQSWMGSDFSNDDLVRGSSTVEDYQHKLLRTELFNGRDCYVIELVPLPEAAIVYDKVLIWVDKKEYIQMKVENYDEFGDCVSTITFSDIRMMGGREIPAIMEMVPHDKSGHKTVIETHHIEFDIPIQDSFFSQQNLRSLK